MDKKRLGVMVDCSRNAVMTVDIVKKFIDALSKMGYNMLMLYTEDTYEVDNQPWFGYLRGRYSKDEMKEIIKEYLVAEAKVNAFHRAHEECWFKEKKSPTALIFRMPVSVVLSSVLKAAVNVSKAISRAKSTVSTSLRKNCWNIPLKNTDLTTMPN